MKRHDALADLSRDHRDALVHAKRLKEVAEAGDDAGVRARAERFLRFWEKHAQPHFREEEEILLPRYAGRAPGGGDPAVQRLLEDHAWIRAAVATLRSDLARGDAPRGLLADLGTRLHDHVRMEEGELFERVQRALSERELSDLAAASGAFRLAARGPGSIGPDREACEL